MFLPYEQINENNKYLILNLKYEKNPNFDIYEKKLKKLIKTNLQYVEKIMLLNRGIRVDNQELLLVNK